MFPFGSGVLWCMATSGLTILRPDVELGCPFKLRWGEHRRRVCANTQVLTGEMSNADVRSWKNEQVEVFEWVSHGHNCNGLITESEHPQNCSSYAAFPVCSGNGAEPATGSGTVEAHRCMCETLMLILAERCGTRQGMQSCRPARLLMLTPVPHTKCHQRAREHQNWTTEQRKKVTLAESHFHVAHIWETHGTRMHDKKKASRQRQRHALGLFSAMKPLVPPSVWILLVMQKSRPWKTFHGNYILGHKKQIRNGFNTKTGLSDWLPKSKFKKSEFNPASFAWTNACDPWRSQFTDQKSSAFSTLLARHTWWSPCPSGSGRKHGDRHIKQIVFSLCLADLYKYKTCWSWSLMALKENSQSMITSKLL